MSGTRGWLAAVVSVAAIGVGSAALPGCTTDAFCFNDCPGQVQSGSGTGTGGEAGSISVGNAGSAGCGIFGCGGEGGTGGACVKTNGGIEICDGLDNDCNGTPDDGPDIDFNSIGTCGTCDNSCVVKAENCADIECVPSAKPGIDPGTCKCNECEPNYKDLDMDGVSCEFGPCIPTGDPETTCNNLDDDCDGSKDEDVDVCTSLTDCGKCNNNCVVLHGTPACVNDGTMPCDDTNTKCTIQGCDQNGPGDTWWDNDNSPDNGCEYQCDLTNAGVEICGDGLDNDCDGDIDSADSDLSGDPAIGVVCYGDPDGECATAAHAGMTICMGLQVVCAGANLLHENDKPEKCDGVDNDCDGAVDDNPTDVGGVCPGGNNIFPCNPGQLQCQNGAVVCVGKVDPGVEVCNGQDDDCDGAIDKTGNNPPADSVGPCDVPPPPPPNVPQPCMAGAKACQGGTIVCNGSVVLGDPGTSANDACGVDSNCDGQLTNQPNLQTDVANCGMCGNNCNAGAVHANWGCNAGACQFLGCQPGYYDNGGPGNAVAGDNKCGYACIFVSAQEACNNQDDNCNGVKDEGVVPPSPVSVCGVSPSATTPECKSTSQGGTVSVACTAGAWVCTFGTVGVCQPNCAGATEICDAVDNNCNGLVNENTPNFGKPCATPASDGACQGQGTFICSGPNGTTCNAVKKDCATLPGGCAEACDGVDNDCDGLVDESFNNKGTGMCGAQPCSTYFVKPVVTKVAAARWMFSYEASRPSATNVIPGNGNGFECVNSGGATCNFVVNGVTKTVPAPPVNTPADKVPACSVPTKIPWFNVSPAEVEHICAAAGGSVCTSAPTPTASDWRTACEATLPCTWGYNPHTAAACNSTFTGSKFCNLGPSYDFSPVAGDQDGLLPTNSNLLQNCSADWSATLGNLPGPCTPGTAGNCNKLFDITGNLREITKDTVNAAVYRLMGGAFNTQDVNGATCQFSFYSVAQDFKFYDTGFRCCFSADPTL